MQHLNILLADDDPDIRELVTEGLLARGHNITVCRDGNELLKLLERGPGPFDVIITDNNMPGGPNGLSIVAELRRHRKGFEHIPIILHSHTHDDEEMKEMVEMLKGILCAKKSDNSWLFSQIDALAKDD